MATSKSVKPGKSRDVRSKSKHRNSKAPTVRKLASQKMMRLRTVAAKSAGNRKDRSNTKQAQVIALLLAPSGATIDAMMRATGWQQHTVRGFLAAVVRKKLGLDLESKVAESGRVYRINGRAASSAASTNTAA